MGMTSLAKLVIPRPFAWDPSFRVFGAEEAILDGLGEGDNYGSEHEIEAMSEAPGPISSRLTGSANLQSERKGWTHILWNGVLSCLILSQSLLRL